MRIFDMQLDRTVVVSPPLHDGSFDGVILRQAEAGLFLRSADNQQFTLVARGVERLLANNVREGNTIFQVTISRGSECTIEQLREVVSPSAFDPNADKYLHDLHARVVSERMAIVQLDCSYGCVLSMLCKETYVFESYCLANLEREDAGEQE